MPNLDSTHDPGRRSWVESANDPQTDFPIQNLPYCVFRRRTGDTPPSIGVAIGDKVLDVRSCVLERLLFGKHDSHDDPASALMFSLLNPLLEMRRNHWSKARHAIADLLDQNTGTLRDNHRLVASAVIPATDVEFLRPVVVGDYTDFYASIHHATNVGSMFRPDQPLLPNYRHLPVGYHGRASSIVVSGTPVRRPMGQTVTNDAGPPTFGPCKLLDYEMELGFFVGPGNALGDRIDMRDAANHIFGMVIVNDWSARDIQKWEYQPLGPFNAKNFATTISPWVVTFDALQPFMVSGPPRDENDPPMLDYLKPKDDFGIDITVEVWLASEEMRNRSMPAVMISRGSFKEMYWTIAQMLVHHTSTGCNLRPGDLLASGTVSGPAEDARGCLLERTWRGQNPITLPDGSQRKFLQDGDEVIMKAYCQREGFRRIGFGECRGVILPAKE